jgi:hypothetical protein
LRVEFLVAERFASYFDFGWGEGPLGPGDFFEFFVLFGAFLTILRTF